MANKKLVIVESPMKARTIKRFLPSDYIVEASMGHVRDLPQSAADIPEKYRKEAWARFGVNVEKNFEPLYVAPKGKSKIIANLKKLMKQAVELYLATDEDREGESISWHLHELLKPKIPVKRLVFHEITKSAISKALNECRDIDPRLVSSQETRRILDRLVGYTLSPLIWKKIAYGLSAGRVQSAGLRLLVERERERMAFKKAYYWDVKAQLESNGTAFEARLISYQQKRVAMGKDFEPTSGQLLKPNEVMVLTQDQALKLSNALTTKPWQVTDLDEKDITSKPHPPFITSTLQQEANRKLGMSARQAMRTAQSLYEQGLITYMRTDSPQLSQQAILGARTTIEKLYGHDYLSPEPRQFVSKSRSAQEAHEAIRPAGESFVHPREASLAGQELALYDLIWKRTLASQMADSKKRSVSAKIQVDEAIFTASGTNIVFAGYLRTYVEGSDDPEAALEDKETLLPALHPGDVLKLIDLLPDGHETKPVARYTEASLVQRLEKEGIGRPSTYANIIGTILERNYARKVGNALVPTFTGFAVIQLLEKHFQHLVDYQFTSRMEDALDEIAEGKRQSLPYLREFYLGDAGLQSQVDQKDSVIDASASRQVALADSGQAEVRVGRFGPYVLKKNTGSEETRASIPEDIAPADLTLEKINEILQASENGPSSLGKHPDNQQDIFVLLGRYGPYVQLGTVTPEQEKPKRASIPKEIDYRQITLEQAINLLKIPYEVGKHPDSGLGIMACVGRFGPFLAHGEDKRSVKKGDDIYSISLERALEILSEERISRARSAIIQDFGTHPTTKKKLAVLNGKYGPFIKHGSKNIKLPEGEDPATISVDRVLQLIKDA